MGFEDDLTEAVRQGQQQRTDAEQEVRDFDARWLKIRKDVVLPVLERAKLALKAKYTTIEVGVEPPEGAVFVAEYGGPRESHEHSITFTFDRKTRHVVAKMSAYGTHKESVPLDEVTPEFVEGCAKRLATALGRRSMVWPRG